MEELVNELTNWGICTACLGRGIKTKKLSKKVRNDYQLAFAEFEKSNGRISEPIKPKGHISACSNCSGSGLILYENGPIAVNEHFPHVAIVGGGIGGVALAIACMHRGIPFTLYERDIDFKARSQGYGLTLQQASKAIDGLGILSLKNGVISTKHVVHTAEGKVIGEWGMRKWLSPSDQNTSSKKSNIHIARQSLRLAFLTQLGGHEQVNWGHQLIDYQATESEGIKLKFQVKGEIINHKADLLVGADGIRSAVRSLSMGEEKTPLRYLGCIVILGICPLSALGDFESHLLDSETVFQTANGHERIYMMPYTSDQVMWQLSFPLEEEEAKALSAKGAQALKEEAIRRTPWHHPIPQILEATAAEQVSGYPVYDRELLNPNLLKDFGAVTLIGDAAHPMSPFKGQGANQAVLDALILARGISSACASAHWRADGLRGNVLKDYESEMITRSSVKVKDSADAAKFLHSESVLVESNEPRGSCRKKD